MNKKTVLLLTDDYTNELLTPPECFDIKADVEIIPYNNQGINSGKYNGSLHESEILIRAIIKHLEDSRKVLIIHCHSFDNKPINGNSSQQIQAPDLLIGSDDFHTPRGLYKYALILLRLRGYNVKLNNCDSGGDLPMAYYQKNKNVYWITILLNRALSSMPGTNKRNDNCDALSCFLQDFINKLSSHDFKTTIPNLIKV